MRHSIVGTALREMKSDRDEACDLLAPVYGWFTEGFNPCDL